MKENGINKLMGYVKEMQEEGINICRPLFQQYYLVEMVLISKNYGLVKRLVEHGKIDDSKVGNSDMLSVQYHDLVNDYKYEGLIMILSISENPISDLCSYLK